MDIVSKPRTNLTSPLDFSLHYFASTQEQCRMIEWSFNSSLSKRIRKSKFCTESRRSLLSYRDYFGVLTVRRQ